MSSTAGTRVPGGQAQPAAPGGTKQAGGLSLVSATALVIGSIIGTGVFTMPAVMAAGGTSSLAVLAVVGVGAMLLAVLFGQLARRVPDAAGGLYAYARHEYGDFAGYVTAWSYWISSWAGNAAIVASWVFYVNVLFGWGHPSGWADWGIALVGLWVPAAVNLAGLRRVAWLQNVTVVLKFLPLAFIGVVGWFFIKAGNFGPFNASGGSLYSAIGIAASVALFAFIGVEVAAITAKRVTNPRRNVGRASVLGTGISAVLYLLVAAVVMGLVPHHALVGNGAPFVDAYQAMFPHGSWAGKLIATTAVVSGLGALNGWTLVTAEVSRAPADDGLFPGAFGWSDRSGNAWFGVVIAAVLPSLLMLWRYTSGTGLTVFTYLVDLTVVSVAIRSCSPPVPSSPCVRAPPGPRLAAGPGPAGRRASTAGSAAAWPRPRARRRSRRQRAGVPLAPHRCAPRSVPCRSRGRPTGRGRETPPDRRCRHRDNMRRRQGRPTWL